MTSDKLYSSIMLRLLKTHGEMSVQALGKALIEEVSVGPDASSVRRLFHRASRLALKKMRLYDRSEVLSNATFYTVARQLQHEGRITSRWKVPEKPRRGAKGQRFYSLSQAQTRDIA